jgi:hypothetical protein
MEMRKANRLVDATDDRYVMVMAAHIPAAGRSPRSDLAYRAQENNPLLAMPENRLRHPKFVALREDKVARIVVRE